MMASSNRGFEHEAVVPAVVGRLDRLCAGARVHRVFERSRRRFDRDGRRDHRINDRPNRIERLEVDARHITRQIDGHTRTIYTTAAGEKVAETMPPATGQHAEKLWAQRDELDAQIAHWCGIRDAQIATGEAASHSRDTITAGDAVQVSDHWYRVIRANAKSVAVATA